VLSLLPIAWLLLALPDRVLYSVPPPWKYLMLSGQLVALAFLAIGVLQTGIWSFLGLSQLGASRSTPQGLVTSGLYRFVRHPLYAAGLAFLWLSPALTVDRLVVFVCGTVYIVVGAFFEERKLRREFGQVYAAYAAVTPMLIPFVKGNKSST
jgi:protein-S-isoprenylcysteine O-methyltransferase Ste14